MKKYFVILKSIIDYYGAYRLSFLLWRFRQVLRLLLIFFLWNSIYTGKGALFGYTKAEMLTYILLSSLVSTIVLASRTQEIAEGILNGDVVNYLLKPISFFKVYFTRDIGDKLLNSLFSIVEIALFVVLLNSPLILSQRENSLILCIFFALNGIVLFFFINLILSFIAFWSTEIWAPRFIMQILIFFLSGTYFPLDILPRPIYYILLATPFPYLYYLPVKIYLRGPDELFTIQLLMSFVWIFLSYYAAKILWQKGLKSYSFFGR